jgi:hypothetical protein
MIQNIPPPELWVSPSQEPVKKIHLGPDQEGSDYFQRVAISLLGLSFLIEARKKQPTTVVDKS